MSIHAINSCARENFQSRWLGSLDPRSIKNVKELTQSSYTSSDKGWPPVLEFLKTTGGVRSLTLKHGKDNIIIEKLSLSEEGNVLFPQLESLTFREPTSVFWD